MRFAREDLAGSSWARDGVSGDTWGGHIVATYYAEITWGPWKVSRLAESREKVVHRRVFIYRNKQTGAKTRWVT